MTFSAPFDRAFGQWEHLATALDTGAVRSVLAVEPESRAFLLDRFEQALGARGWQTRRSGSGNLPDFMKAERHLPALTRLWRQVGAPGSYQPQTWWEPPTDDYLIERVYVDVECGLLGELAPTSAFRDLTDHAARSDAARVVLLTSSEPRRIMSGA